MRAREVLIEKARDIRIKVSLNKVRINVGKVRVYIADFKA